MSILAKIVRWLKDRRAERKRKIDTGELCPYRVRGCDGNLCDDCILDRQI